MKSWSVWHVWNSSLTRSFYLNAVHPSSFIPHPSSLILHPSSLILSFSFRTLVQRITAFAVKVAKVFSLDEIETRARDVSQQVDDLLMLDGSAAGLRHEPAAPVIRTEGFRVTAGPDLHAAVADHHQL